MLIEEVSDVDTIEEDQIRGFQPLWHWGIHTKIRAAKLVNGCGIPMVLANGRKDNIILGLLEGREKASLFYPKAIGREKSLITYAIKHP